MDGIRSVFILMVRTELPKDGSLNDAYDEWLWAFNVAMDNPQNTQAVQYAKDVIYDLFKKLKTP